MEIKLPYNSIKLGTFYRVSIMAGLAVDSLMRRTETLLKCPATMLLCGLLVPLVIAGRSDTGYSKAKQPHNVSTLLNDLLLGYDSRLRPGHGGLSECLLSLSV